RAAEPFRWQPGQSGGMGGGIRSNRDRRDLPLPRATTAPVRVVAYLPPAARYRRDRRRAGSRISCRTLSQHALEAGDLDRNGGGDGGAGGVPETPQAGVAAHPPLARGGGAGGAW